MDSSDKTKLWQRPMLILFILSMLLQRFALIQGYRRIHNNIQDNADYISLGRWSQGSKHHCRQCQDGGTRRGWPLDLSAWASTRGENLDSAIPVGVKLRKRPSKRPASTDETKEESEEILPPPSPSESTQETDSSAAALDRETILRGVTQPLIPQNVWDQLSGDEFDDPHVVDALAKTGLKMAITHEDNGWIAWKDNLPKNIDAALDQEDFVCTGTALRPGYGSEVPWIKSMSVLPMSPSEVSHLMMDSTQVQSYNSLSLGRKDLKNIPPPPGAEEPQQTKIVRNVVQLPVANKKVDSVTLLHSRKLEDGSHLLVSRAVDGKKYATDGKIGRSYILLGVNLFEPIPNSPDQCRMTAITHVYQPGVPLMIAGKVGVKSAKNFIKGIRALSVPVSQ